MIETVKSQIYRWLLLNPNTVSPSKNANKHHLTGKKKSHHVKRLHSGLNGVSPTQAPVEVVTIASAVDQSPSDQLNVTVEQFKLL